MSPQNSDQQYADSQKQERYNALETSQTNEQLILEIQKEQENILEDRNKRILLEDKILSENPDQRSNNLLDYIRRGHLKDPDIYIMPEIIQTFPYILEKGLIDITADDYDEQKTMDSLIKIFKEIEDDVLARDRQIRNFLESKGVRVTYDQYLDQTTYGEILKVLQQYLKIINSPIHPKSPFHGKPQEYKQSIREKTASKLSAYFLGDLNALFDDYEANNSHYQLEIATPDLSDPIKKFIYKKNQKGFKKYPRISEYRGETVENVPTLKNQKRRPGIMFVERDELPDIKGGIILDGNFGYDKDGNLVNPDDKRIIDHHDKFNSTLYDTATVMVGRYWESKSGKIVPLLQRKEELKKYATRNGAFRLNIMINHMDSDSILSVWAFRNPKKAKKYKQIINNISFCGDFMVGSGVMEYGANARDYEYIISNYMSACREKIKQERTQELERELEQKRQELKIINTEKTALTEELDNIRSRDPDIIALSRELEQIKGDKGITPKDKGKMIGQKSRELENILKSKAGTNYERKITMDRRGSDLQKEIDKLNRQISDAKVKGLSGVENEKVISHVLDIIEDIITNPFKYRKYLFEGRDKEDKTIKEMDKLYRSGEIEITPDPHDPEILVLRPLKSSKMPGIASIDGEYFFLRKREDFNQKIIVTRDGQSVMMAINTQDKKLLQDYDFDEMLDVFKMREDLHINENIEKTKTEQVTEEDPKMKKALTKKLEELKQDKQKNVEGKLWRNRTQMIFAFKSYIPEEEIMTILREWKKKNDQKETESRKE